ncbi:MAG TPA: EAL domain-containing protein [Pyrinomonadaceae bacterium]|jgi:diguanylate cyclase (GGDEF)-like protein|nr:EAL domain-containing protein [Pyrinomonadaceae bacterium]
MEQETSITGRQAFTQPYKWVVVLLGACACLFSATHLSPSKLDLHFLILLCLTVLVSSRISVRIPRVNATITVSDTFIFVAILLYGAHAAVLLAAVEGMCSGLRLSRKFLTVSFNSAAVASATFLTTHALGLCFGDNLSVDYLPFPAIIFLIGVMALIQYIAHTGIVVVCLALKSGQPIWPTWNKHYLWSSITYISGALIAGLMDLFDNKVGFYSLIVVIPIICIIYFTYHKYLEDIQATAAQAERAERERAEAEHARAEAERIRAEQAECHVEELNHYIAELERTSRELEESREHFRHAAFHDALTGLPNRTLFADFVKLAIERAKRQDVYSFAVLFLDLDRFKYINDSLGHTYGDQLLIEIARRLEKCLRSVDTVARFGGDEFAILLDGIKDSSDAIKVAQKIEEELLLPFNLGRHEAFTSASVGIALSTTGYEHPDDILRDADTAMYRAKDAGKARYELFDTEMHSRAVLRLNLENDMRRAIERQEFRAYYQPIMHLETGKVAGFEALARWEHPERGLVSPTEFIPVAEETGLIVPIGLWMLEEACRQMHEWHCQSPANRLLTISVNLSGKQLMQPDLIEQIEQILCGTGIEPRCLKLEITESVVMENAEVVTVMLNQLRALNIRLSIDDFGTGYSSLSYLHRFPVDTLKIDRSFISRMGPDNENNEIVRTIAKLAQNLGMEIVAEGIETEEQLRQLSLLACEYGQGYLFSHPLSAEATSGFIQRDQQHQRRRTGLDLLLADNEETDVNNFKLVM